MLYDQLHSSAGRQRSEGCSSGQLSSARSSSSRINYEFCSNFAPKWWIIRKYLIGWRMVFRGAFWGTATNWEVRSCFALQKGALGGVQRSNTKLASSSTISCRKIVLQLRLMITDCLWAKKGTLFSHICAAAIRCLCDRVDIVVFYVNPARRAHHSDPISTLVKAETQTMVPLQCYYLR